MINFIASELPAGVILSRSGWVHQRICHDIELVLHKNLWRINPWPGLVVAISIPLVMTVTFLIKAVTAAYQSTAMPMLIGTLILGFFSVLFVPYLASQVKIEKVITLVY